jgi:rubrerythrin
MSTQEDILKQAILLEKRGKAFYEQIAEQTKEVEVKQFFLEMAKEEETHIEILTKQYTHFSEKGKFSEASLDNIPDDLSKMVLSDEIIQKLGAASYESASIGAALDMEKKAVEVYAKQAANTNDPEEKKLYTWLSKWETTHMDYLDKLNKELIEQSWYDNKFWAF